MIYYLNAEQYVNMWNKIDPSRKGMNRTARVKLWDQTISISNVVQYDETTTPDEFGYYGFLQGDEKHIMWFILQL